MFSNLPSQRNEIDQSMAGSVISAIIGHLTQYQQGGGIDNLFSQDNSYSDEDRRGGTQSSLSNLTGQRDSGQLNEDHSLIQRV
ncbi:MAG: hypothetical protein ACTHJ7_03630 [Candidatus Nitrosocosmicus sp.]